MSDCFSGAHGSTPLIPRLSLGTVSEALHRLVRGEVESAVPPFDLAQGR